MSANNTNQNTEGNLFDPLEEMKHVFEQLDKNQDGELNLEEFVSGLMARYEKKGMTLTADQMDRVRHKATAVFKCCDLNKDGSLQEREFVVGYRRYEKLQATGIDAPMASAAGRDDICRATCELPGCTVS